MTQWFTTFHVAGGKGRERIIKGLSCSSEKWVSNCRLEKARRAAKETGLSIRTPGHQAGWAKEPHCNGWGLYVCMYACMSKGHLTLITNDTLVWQAGWVKSAAEDSSSVPYTGLITGNVLLQTPREVPRSSKYQDDLSPQTREMQMMVQGILMDWCHCHFSNPKHHLLLLLSPLLFFFNN